MSYPMVHLKIAYGLLVRDDGECIKRSGDFLLGSVAPDAVHFHDSYDVSLKERSHIWKFGPRWGLCAHLLTDWENDRRIWAPFREKMKQGAERDEVYGEYAQESKGMDLWLYQNDKETQEIWRLLEQGKVCGVDGCILEEDLARQKRFLLYEEFIGKDAVDVSGYRFCTKEVMEEFVERCVEKMQKLINPGNC